MAEKKDKKPVKTIVKNKKKVVDINPNNTVKALEYLLEKAKEGKIDCFVFAGYSPNDEIITSTCDTSVIDHQALVTYLSSLATIRMLTEATEIDEF